MSVVRRAFGGGRMSYAMMNIPARSNVKQLTSEKQALERRIDELCAEVERLKGENAKLRAENERLTETLRGVEREADRLTHEAAEVSIENAKLRELVQLCWAQSGYEVCLTDEQDRAIRVTVCELGIEVSK